MPRGAVRLARAASVALVGALIGAAQLAPARALLPISTRGGGFDAAEGMKWSMEPARLLELVLPQIFGDPTRLSPGAWWGHWLFEGGYPFLLVVYIGAAPILLAAIALLARSRSWWPWGLGGVAILGLVLALGGHTFVYRVLFGSMAAVRHVRYPERFLIVTLFAVAILAAHGLGRLRHGLDVRLTGALVAAAAAVFALISLVAAAPWLVDAILGSISRVPGPILADAAPVLRGAAMRALLWMFVQLSLVAVLAVLARRATAASPRVEGAGWALAAAAGISMVVAAQPALSSADRGWLAVPSPLAAKVAHGPGGPRLHHDRRPAAVSIWGQSDETIWGYRFDRFSYSLATGHADGVATVLDPATDRMDLAAQTGLGQALRSLTIDERLRILRLCGAGFLLTHDALEHPDLIPGPALEGFSRPPLRLYAIRHVLPRVRFRTRAIAAKASGDLVRSLLDPDYDPQRMVMLHGGTDGPAAGAADPAPDDGEAGGEAVLVEDRPESLRLSVRAERPGWVVIGDAHAPGWSARVDGATAPILRADGLFRAVPVAPGSHEVVLTYRAPGIRGGLASGLAGVLIAIGWAVAPRSRPRNVA